MPTIPKPPPGKPARDGWHAVMVKAVDGKTCVLVAYSGSETPENPVTTDEIRQWFCDILPKHAIQPDESLRDLCRMLNVARATEPAIYDDRDYLDKCNETRRAIATLRRNLPEMIARESTVFDYAIRGELVAQTPFLTLVSQQCVAMRRLLALLNEHGDSIVSGARPRREVAWHGLAMAVAVYARAIVGEARLGFGKKDSLGVRFVERALARCGAQASKSAVLEALRGPRAPTKRDPTKRDGLSALPRELGGATFL